MVASRLLFAWSGFDIRYPTSRKLEKRMSNPKLHWQHYIC
jgi:hypothetical protein